MRTPIKVEDEDPEVKGGSILKGESDGNPEVNGDFDVRGAL